MNGAPPRRVDLNADLGEGFGVWTMGDDEAMLDIVSSASVACGFHAGDPSTMRRVCGWAAARGVAVGAHVSYRDLAGFGRRTIEMPSDVLGDEIVYQLGALAGMATAAGTRVGYLKAHGALYNRALDDPETAQVVAAAVRSFDPLLPVLCLPGSALADAVARTGLPVVTEGFVDRAVDGRGRLIPRRQPGAVILDVDAVVARALALVGAAVGSGVEGAAVGSGVEGAAARPPVSSLCLHGDTPGASRLAAAVRAGLEAAGMTIATFVETAAAPG